MDDDSRSVEELRLQVESLQVELDIERERIEGLQNDCYWQRVKLAEAVEVLVEKGIVHNTPKARLDWIEGGRG